MSVFVAIGGTIDIVVLGLPHYAFFFIFRLGSKEKVDEG